MSDDNGKAPVKRFRIGLITASVFENDGLNKSFYTVTLQRSFKNDNGDWQNSKQLNHDDLLNAARVLQRAEAFIAEQQ